MNVVVKLFAGARELAGQETVSVELPAAATVGELRKALLVVSPALKPLLPHALFAIDANYADDQSPIPEHSDIACIPPVSGG